MKTLVYGSSIRGNGHYLTGVECQDSNSFEETDFSDDEMKVVALSDGHGGIPYFRSSIGSEYASSIAKEVVYLFLKEHKQMFDEIDRLEAEKLKKDDKCSEKETEDKIVNLEEKIKQQYQRYQLYKPVVECLRAKHRNEQNWEEGYKKLVDEQKEIFDKNEYVEFCNKTYNPLVREYKRNKEELTKLKQEINVQSLDVNDEVQKKIDENVESVKKDLLGVKLQIISKWNEQVNAHFKNNPVTVSNIEMMKIDSMDCFPKSISFSGYTESETNTIKVINKGLDQKMIEGVLRNYKQIYGATLLCVASYKTHNIFLQIGDGDITVVDSCSNVIHPLTKPENQIANETNSICQLNAAKRFSELYLREKIKMIMISSDGIVNALEDENDLGNLALGIYESAVEEPSAFRKDFKPLLRRFSTNSSDDCTICFIANDIPDDAFNVIKDSVEDTMDDNELLKSYQPKFKSYKLNRELYQIKENRVFVNGVNIDFSTIGYNEFKLSVDKYEDEINSIIDAKKESENIEFKSRLLSKINVKKCIMDNLKDAEDELKKKILQDYDDRLGTLVLTNPIKLIKGNTTTLYLNDKEQLVAKKEEIVYGIVTEVLDDKISFIRLTEDRYESINEDMVSKLRFNGTIELSNGHKLEINNSKISFE